jgi:L-fuconate dehydratase
MIFCFRGIIDDPAEISAERVPPEAATLIGKNAGPTGSVLMIDANQVTMLVILRVYIDSERVQKVWDVPEAIAYVKDLAELKPW